MNFDSSYSTLEKTVLVVNVDWLTTQFSQSVLQCYWFLPIEENFDVLQDLRIAFNHLPLNFVLRLIWIIMLNKLLRFFNQSFNEPDSLHAVVHFFFKFFWFFLQHYGRSSDFLNRTLSWFKSGCGFFLRFATFKILNYSTWIVYYFRFMGFVHSECLFCGTCKSLACLVLNFSVRHSFICSNLIGWLLPQWKMLYHLLLWLERLQVRFFSFLCHFRVFPLYSFHHFLQLLLEYLKFVHINM